MDALQAPLENKTEQHISENYEPEINLNRIEAMVTPEQVLSATVAKKRRNFTKKRNAHNNRAREQTPVREMDDKTTTEDEEVIEPKPKTPDRKRRKKIKNVSKQNLNSRTETEVTETESDAKIDNHDLSFRQKLIEEFRKKDGLADMAQTEVLGFLNRTRKSIAAAASRSRDKFRKFDKERLKRSKSAPHTFTEEELIESFRKAQLLTVGDNQRNALRKYSDSSLISLTVTEPVISKPFRPEVEEFVRQRRKEKTYSNKIIEILDPKTSNVIATKAVVKPNFNFSELIAVLRIFTIREIRTNFKIFKLDMKIECERIRKLRNRCMCELFLIMIFCGFGGILFKLVEGSFEYFYKCGVKRVKRDFIDMLWIKSHNLREEDWKSLARNKLRNFEEELHTAHEAGMKTYSGQRSWSFMNGVVYALTIITTIGYGHIYPETITGKALTIVYAIIGLPLFLIALTDFGKLFTRGIKFLWSFVRRLYYTGSCRRVRKQAQVQELFKGAQMMYEIATLRRPSMFVDPENPPKQTTEDGTPVGEDTPTTPAISNFEIDDEFNLPISLAIFILILYIIIGCCILLLVETEWTFFDAFYFIFISMSTIGFGDIVPDKPFFMIASIVYLVFGLALTSMCINVVQAKLSDTFKQASSKLGATIGFEVDDEGNVINVPPEPVELPEVHGMNKVPDTQLPDEDNNVKDNVKDKET